MHAIQILDRGIVTGDATWHNLPQYTVIGERWVTVDEAIDIANYPIEKRQLIRHNGEPAQAWEIVRSDHDVALVDHVGDRFEAETNLNLVNHINENLLAEFPDLKIESVGTLYNGATFFISLRIDKFRIKGDRSDTVTNVMALNPLGRGSHLGCCHTTRVVCNNTATMAAEEGKAADSLLKFRHTASANTKINDHLANMAELKLGLQRHKMMMDHLSCVDANRDMVTQFLDAMFPMPKDEGRAHTIAKNNRETYMTVWHGQRDTLETPTSKYSLFQAFTDTIDHHMTSRNSDDAAVMMDGITGIRSAKKQKALDWLVAA